MGVSYKIVWKISPYILNTVAKIQTWPTCTYAHTRIVGPILAIPLFLLQLYPPHPQKSVLKDWATLWSNFAMGGENWVGCSRREERGKLCSRYPQSLESQWVLHYLLIYIHQRKKHFILSINNMKNTQPVVKYYCFCFVLSSWDRMKRLPNQANVLVGLPLSQSMVGYLLVCPCCFYIQAITRGMGLS